MPLFWVFCPGVPCKLWPTLLCLLQWHCSPWIPLPCICRRCQLLKRMKTVHLQMSTAIYYDSHKLTSALIYISPPFCASSCSHVFTASMDVSKVAICDIKWICQWVQFNSNTITMLISALSWLFHVRCNAVMWIDASPLIAWGLAGYWCILP